jgi:hypothetical protein
VSANFITNDVIDESNSINMGSITSIIVDESIDSNTQTTFLEYNIQP